MGAIIDTRLRNYRAIWQRKLALRVIYNDFYDRITATCVPGATIEIGGGGGNLKERLGDVIATDIQFARVARCCCRCAVSSVRAVQRR